MARPKITSAQAQIEQWYRMLVKDRLKLNVAQIKGMLAAISIHAHLHGIDLGPKFYSIMRSSGARDEKATIEDLPPTIDINTTTKEIKEPSLTCGPTGGILDELDEKEED
jgi:hypothetical protein